MKLYGYWRSTSSYRLRIVLALKGIGVKHHFVHLVHGEQKSDAYRALNPQGRVPMLVLDDGVALTQSPAIIEYLEEVFPDPPLLPADAISRAKVRAIAAIIGCDIHPLHNVAALNYLGTVFARPESDRKAWIAEWISQGFAAIEAMIGNDGFCFGPKPSLADVYLVPQIYAARRFNVPLDPYPRILRVERLAADDAKFCTASPGAQKDAVVSTS